MNGFFRYKSDNNNLGTQEKKLWIPYYFEWKLSDVLNNVLLTHYKILDSVC